MVELLYTGVLKTPARKGLRVGIPLTALFFMQLIRNVIMKTSSKIRNAFALLAKNRKGGSHKKRRKRKNKSEEVFNSIKENS